MISKSIFIGIFLLLSIEAEAQTIWDVTFVSNSFQGVPWGVSFSGDNGTGIGGIFSYDSSHHLTGSGQIYHSTNGGHTWVLQCDSNNANFSSVFQIDSLNVIISGAQYTQDSLQYLIWKTTDAGATWQTYNAPDNISSMDFSDSLNGIAGNYNTSDGGKNWNVIPPLVDAWSWNLGGCVYGKGKYCLIGNPPEPDTGTRIITTFDNWSTVQTLVPDSNFNYSLAWLGENKEIYLLGYRDSGWFLIHSLDGGEHWTDTIYMAHTTATGNMTTPIRDTMYEESDYYFGTPLEGDSPDVPYSIDRGRTWIFDSLRFSTNVGKKPGAYGIYSMADGSCLGVFSSDSIAFLARSRFLSSIVDSTPKVSNTSIYPNPSHDILNIELMHGSISIFDPLGRSYSVPKNGSTLDVSSLPAGIYFITDGMQSAKFVKE